MKRWEMVVYGSGDWSLASFNTFRQIFYPVFLTNVVGLDPRLASLASLAGIAWDAVNDPIVGAISDRASTRFGRRRPFLFAFAVPYGLAFSLLWWAPPWTDPLLVTATAAGLYVITDTMQTLVSVPFLALLPELTGNYDERTQATAWRMVFNLSASLSVAVGAPVVVDFVRTQGVPDAQVWAAAGALFGAVGAIPPLLIGALLREKRPTSHVPEPTIVESFRQALSSRSFRHLVPVYLLAYTTFDLAAMMIPYWVGWHLGGGTLTAGPLELPTESWMLGSMLLVAIAALPMWERLSRTIGKQRALGVGAMGWVFAHVAIFVLPPGAGWAGVAVAAFAGLGVSVAHVIPDAMLPDVIDEAKLTYGGRTEGVFFGARNLFRKAAGALAVFVGLQGLGWAGYDGTLDAQPESAMFVIRFLLGPVCAAMVLGCAIFGLTHPLTRARHEEIRRALAERTPNGPPPG